MNAKRAILLLTGVSLVAIAALGWLGIHPPHTTNQSLPQLVQSITQTIEAADYEAFCNLVDGDAPPREIFNWLIAQQQRLDYNELFANQRSDSGSDKFTLGGHEFGHLHLDFVQSATGWRLIKVWNCR